MKRQGPVTARAPERYPFKVKKSEIQGIGVFPLANLPRRRKIGEITGELVRLPQARKAIEHTERIYLVELTNRLALDCSRGNSLACVNHSCAPNCYLRIINTRVEMYTLREIKAGTELTIDYGVTPHANGMRCVCGVKHCRGKL